MIASLDLAPDLGPEMRKSRDPTVLLFLVGRGRAAQASIVNTS